MARTESELERALARADAASLQRLVALHREWTALDGDAEQSFYNKHDELGQVFEMESDPDKGLAYAAIALATYDDREYLAVVAALCLEDALRQPPPEIIDRAEAEALRSERFRWLIGGVYPHAISEAARERLLPLALPPNDPIAPRSSV